MNDAWNGAGPQHAPAFSAVMLAAGLSSRMQGQHKLLLPVGGQPAGEDVRPKPEIGRNREAGGIGRHCSILPEIRKKTIQIRKYLFFIDRVIFKVSMMTEI